MTSPSLRTLSASKDSPQETDDSPSLKKALFRNISTWGPAAKKLMKTARARYDVLGFGETHALADGTSDILDHWSRNGYKGIVSPARPSFRADKTGGTSIGVSNIHQSESFRHLAALPEQTQGAAFDAPFRPGPVDFWDFTPVSWRLKGRNLVLAMCYLSTTIGYTGDNVKKLNLIGSFLKSLKDLWVLAGDFNMTPEQLVKTGWLDKVNGVIIPPFNVDHTCTAGQARIIDYLVIPAGAQIFFRAVRALLDGAFLSHLALEVDIDVMPLASIRWSLRLPLPLPHPPVEQKTADPNSKASRAKAARILRLDPQIARSQRRRAALLADTRKVKHDAALALRKGLPPPSTLSFAPTVPASISCLNEPEHEDDMDPCGWQEEDEPFPEGPEDYDEYLAQPEQEPEVAGASTTDAEAPATAAEPATLARTDELFLTPVWEHASVSKRNMPTPPSYVVESTAYALTKSAANPLAHQFAKWASRMETFYMELYQVDPMVRRTYMGRACLAELRLGPVSAQPVAALTHSEADTWWAATASSVALLARMKAGGKASASKISAQADRISSRAGRAPTNAEPQLNAKDLEQWDDKLRTCLAFSPGDLRDLAAAARHNSTLAAHEVVRRAQREFTEWFDADDLAGCGKLHRAAKPLHLPADEYISYLDGSSSGSQVEFLEDKRRAWAKRWCHDGTHQVELLRELHNFRLEAMEVPREPLLVQDLVEPLRNEPGRKARGLVQLAPQDVARLPLVGKQALVDLLNECEANAAWPWQFLAVAVALIPKNGGDRGLGILPWITRLWARVRSSGLSEWIDRTADPWDDAVAGGSALRQALRRSFMDESAAELNLATASTLFDVKEFFDSIDLLKVLRAARHFQFPTVDLVLLYLEHLAPRLLRIKGAYAPAIQPHRGTIAGCRGAQQFARIVLKRILFHVHTRFHPLVVTKSWVDDVNQRSEGSEQEVADAIVDAGCALAEGIQALNLVVADKSRVIASKWSLAKSIAARFAKLKVPILAASTAADLGIDRGSGVAAAKPTGSKRFRRSMVKAAVFAKFSRGARRSRTGRKLFNSGVVPQAAHHAKVHGMPPTQVAKVRTAAGAVLNNASRGRCLTTRLALEYKDSDPGIAIPMALIDAWIDFLVHHPEDYERAKQTWPLTLKRLRSAKHRWRKVRGAMSAVIATLLDLGWDPVQVNRWIDGEGSTWHFDDEYIRSPLINFAPFKTALAKALRAKLWRKAADFHHGKGLQDGVDLDGLRRHLAHLLKRNEYERHGAVVAVTTGAPWTRSRIKEDANPDFDTTCARCGAAVEDDLHRYWKCPANRDLALCNKSEHLAKKAILGSETTPCFWLRGLVPADWIKVDPPPLSAEPTFVPASVTTENDARALLRGTSSRPLLACGDGSGGTASSDPRLRRAAWAWALMDNSASPEGNAAHVAAGWSSPLVGDFACGQKQTVNRAELSALLDFLKQSAGDADFITDSAYVLKGVRRIQSGQHKKLKSNLDLWRECMPLVAQRTLRVHKVESHIAEDHPDVLNKIIPLDWVRGNTWADEFAGLAAAEAAVPVSQAEAIGWVDRTASIVRNRLAAILIDCTLKDPRTRQPPRPKTAMQRQSAIEKHARLLAAFNATSHSVDSGSRSSYRCRVCGTTPGTSGPTAWLKTACVAPAPLPFAPAAAAATAEDSSQNVGHASIHKSHTALFFADLGVWICSGCGACGEEHLRHLARECPVHALGRACTQAGKDALSRVRRGMKPGASAAAKAFNANLLRTRATAVAPAPAAVSVSAGRRKRQPHEITPDRGLPSAASNVTPREPRPRKAPKMQPAPPLPVEPPVVYHDPSYNSERVAFLQWEMGDALLMPAVVQDQPSAAEAAVPSAAPAFDDSTRELRRASLLQSMRAALAPDADAQ